MQLIQNQNQNSLLDFKYELNSVLEKYNGFLRKYYCNILIVKVTQCSKLKKI